MGAWLGAEWSISYLTPTSQNAIVTYNNDETRSVQQSSYKDYNTVLLGFLFLSDKLKLHL